MQFLKRTFIFLTLTASVLFGFRTSKAAHFHSAEVYWECLTTGPDAGKFKFYVIIYKDCSSSTAVDPPQLNANVPTFGSLGLTLSAGFPQDVTPDECGFTCADGIQDLSLEKYRFESEPVTIPGPPPPSGYTFYYEPCCRIAADNLVDSEFEVTYYAVTMYPYNNQNTDPCFDSSPQFAEPPNSIQCSGYEMRYNSNAIDPDLDSLTYQLTEALVGGGIAAEYEPGFSPTQPMPGPNPVILNPVTGQLQYDSSPNVAGRYTTVLQVDAWKCGQLVSRSIRDMTFAFTACNEVNNIPTVAAPVWNSPAGASGYSVIVQAGDLVSFSLEGIDNDIINGLPQNIELTAVGQQFASDFSNPSGNCSNTPCATLSNVTPPSSAVGSISTEFNWQTSCDHVGIYDNCGNLTNTYNFLFKFKDDYCPASGQNMVNVSVTVVGEEIVDSPQPHCVSTDANGDITISWEPVVDNSNPPSFVEYVISHSTSPNGPFQEIGTVANINTGTYLHDAGNAVAAPSTSGPNYYIIQTRSGCDDAIVLAPVDTVSSIYLTLANNGATADLSWTPVATPPLPSSNGNGQGLYQVYREYPAGTWDLIGTTTGLTYSDPVIWCNEQINYRIELTDNLPCVSVSNVVGDVLSNATDPDPQVIDSVTVENELARISWSPNGQTNVTEYTIEQNNAGIWTPLNTVVGYNNTDWVNPASQAGTVSEIYRVKATNDCLISGEPGLFHRTILTTVVGDGCERSATISWTEYINWPEGVREYEIHASENGNPEQLIGTVADSVFEFVHEGLTGEATYCYRVVAMRDRAERITSTSNDTCVYIYIPKRPDHQYQYNTTVQAGNTGVDTYFFVDSTAGYLGFEVQRGTSPDALGTIWFEAFDPTTQYYSYSDPNARPAFNSYYYAVIGVDSCDQYADTLNINRTILLEAEPNSNRTNSLQWNPYEAYNGDVIAYNIFRSVDGPFEYRASVPPTQLTFLDSVQEIIVGEGNFCYYVEAVEGVGSPIGTTNPVTFLEKSRSNEACARQHPNVFVPNAFMPEGVNNVFKPVNVYVQSNSYLFQIYNRWGQRIFETNEPTEGWSGDGYPQGAYVYFISFVSSNGETYTKSGSVTLIR